MSDRYQLLPPLTDDEYAALRSDIEQRGVLVPIVFDQHGQVLDGHHRLRIVAELGIDTYPTEVVIVDDHEAAQAVALTLNLSRRHLTREQKRAMVAAEIEARPDDSDRAIARRMHCSPSTVGAVRREVSNLDTIDQVEAAPLTDDMLGGLDVLEFALITAMRNAVEPAVLIGWLTTAKHRAVAKHGPGIYEPILDARIYYLAKQGDEHLTVTDPEPLDAYELEGLGHLISGEALETTFDCIIAGGA